MSIWIFITQTREIQSYRLRAGKCRYISGVPRNDFQFHARTPFSFHVLLRPGLLQPTDMAYHTGVERTESWHQSASTLPARQQLQSDIYRWTSSLLYQSYCWIQVIAHPKIVPVMFCSILLTSV